MQHFQGIKICKEVLLSEKKRREKRLPVGGMTARLLIVVIGEGSRVDVLPEGNLFSFGMINCTKNCLVLPVAYD